MAGADSYVFNRAPTSADFPRANFDWLGNLPNDFWQGQQYGRERQLQTMFQPGTPGADLLSKGDYAGALQQIATVGGAPAIGPNLPLLMRLKFGQQLLNGGPANPAGGSPAPQAPPQPQGAYGSAPFAASSSKNGTGPANLGGNPAIGSDDQGETTVRSLFPGDNNVPQEEMDRVATAVGARPPNGMTAADMPLTPQQTQRAQQLIQGRAGGRPVASSSVAASQGSTGSSPAIGPPASSPNTPAGRDVVAQGPSTTANGYLSTDSEAASQNRRRAAAGIRQKALAASAAGLDDMAKQFDATASTLEKQADEIDGRIAKRREAEYGVDIAGRTKALTSVEEARGKRIGEVIEAGGQAARHTLNTLHVMKDAMDRAGNSITTGPGADWWLKAKQAAQNLFPSLEIKGLQEAEVITKLNAMLAAESAKAMTARPSQLEFKTFVQNNPGLMTTVKGTKFLLDVLTQTKEQDIALSHKALRLKDLNSWGDVEDKFYKDNPIKSPFTGKALTGNETLPADQSGPQPGKYRWTPDGGLQAHGG